MNSQMEDISVQLKWKMGTAIKHRNLNKFIKLANADSSILELIEPKMDVRYFLWRTNEKNYIVTNNPIINTYFLRKYFSSFWKELGRPKSVIFHPERNSNNGEFSVKNKPVEKIKSMDIQECKNIIDSISYKDILNDKFLEDSKRKDFDEVMDLDNLDVYDLLDLANVLRMDVRGIPWDLSDDEYNYRLRYMISKKIEY